MKDFVTYVRSFDRVTAAAEASVPHSVGEDSEYWDFIIDGSKQRVFDAEFIKEGEPALGPNRVRGTGSVFSDSCATFCCRSAEITDEVVRRGGASILQDSACGEMRSNWVRSCLSGRSKRREALSASTFAGPGM